MNYFYFFFCWYKSRQEHDRYKYRLWMERQCRTPLEAEVDPDSCILWPLTPKSPASTMRPIELQLKFPVMFCDELDSKIIWGPILTIRSVIGWLHRGNFCDKSGKKLSSADVAIGGKNSSCDVWVVVFIFCSFIELNLNHVFVVRRLFICWTNCYNKFKG